MTSRAQWPSPSTTSRTTPRSTRPPHSGREDAPDFPRFLAANLHTGTEEPLHRFFDGDTIALEQNMTGTVLGLPGKSPRVTFDILHLFAFRDGLISGERVRIATPNSRR